MRHLVGFVCTSCGPVEHSSAIEIMAEALLCWPCFLKMLFDTQDPDETDFCPECYPTSCPADGTVFGNGRECRAHIRAGFHGSSA